MKAIRVHEFGGLEVLQLEDVPTPQPGAGQVLVRMHAVGARDGFALDKPVQ
jgi:NADPH:quinone reductase-like Zn-dependent oxidoreductase